MRSKNRRRAHRGASGFTLIEILVVLLIIGLLVGLVGQNVFGGLLRGQKGAAEIQIRNFKGALDRYRLDNARYPDTLEELTEPGPEGEPYMDQVPLDPWNNEYSYELQSGGKYLIICYGADGAPGGEGQDADISSEDQ